MVYSKRIVKPNTVKLADEAIASVLRLRRKAISTYPAIIAAAEVTDAEAIHPGYGFLAENAISPSAWKKAGSSASGPGCHPHHG